MKEIFDIDHGNDNGIKVLPYKRNNIKFGIVIFLSIITLGILALVFHWKKRWFVICTCDQSTKEKCDTLIIIDKYKQCYICYINYKKASQTDGHILIDGQKYFKIPFYAANYIYLKEIKFFDYQGNKYVWNPDINDYFSINNFYHHMPTSYFDYCEPLSLLEEKCRREFFGINDLSVKVKPIYYILFYEVLTPFYIFQIFSVILWYNDEYELYASCILIISLISLIQSTYEIRKDQKALYNLSKMNDTVTVFREDGTSETISSHLLVPGNIIKIPSNGCTLTCDVILLNGSCIVNESMLTGESIPVTKTPMIHGNLSAHLPFDKKKQSKHVIFCGTRVIQARFYGTECTKAVVYSTGYNTSKGEIIRSILYPKPCEFNFNQDSYKFVGALFALSFIGFLYSATIKILNNFSVRLIVLRSIDLVTIVVPPALPAAMTIGIVFAKNRLKRFNIFCVSPNHINVGGVLNLFCFDKTGTLTEDGLDILGVVPTFSKSKRRSDSSRSVENSQNSLNISNLNFNINESLTYPEFGALTLDVTEFEQGHLIFCMSTCHSLTTIEGNLAGDPMDVKMFETTRWIMKEPSVADNAAKYDTLVPTVVCPPNDTNLLPREPNNLNISDENSPEPSEFVRLEQASPEIGIIRQFPFLSSFQRMSVVVYRLASRSYEVYCKGSPEMLSTLCDPQTLPPDYHTKLSSFTEQGYRVIALAWRPITDLKWAKIQRINRDQVEVNLRFLGFLVFENKLKPASKPTLGKLKKANIRTVMVTGDHLLTAVSVARESYMIEPGEAVKIVRINPNNADTKSLNLSSPQLNHGGVYFEDLYTRISLSHHLTHASKPENAAIQDKQNSHIFTKPRQQSRDHLKFILPRPSSVEFTSHLTNKATLTGVNDDYQIVIKEPNKRYSAPINYVRQKLNNYAFRNDVRKCHLVITGDVFQYLLDNDIQLLDSILSPSTQKIMVYSDGGGGDWEGMAKCQSTVFARMTPDQKTTLVERFQSLDYYVGMCGDGANDCGALKTAHSGLALSDNEASLVSPFAYTGRDIGGILPLISEGRCSLTTSFGVFKYMAYYSLVQFVSVLLLYWVGASFSDQQFAFVDLCIITLHALAFGRTKAYSPESLDPFRKHHKMMGNPTCDKEQGPEPTINNCMNPTTFGCKLFYKFCVCFYPKKRQKFKVPKPTTKDEELGSSEYNSKFDLFRLGDTDHEGFMIDSNFNKNERDFFNNQIKHRTNANCKGRLLENGSQDDEIIIKINRKPKGKCMRWVDRYLCLLCHRRNTNLENATAVTGKGEANANTNGELSVKDEYVTGKTFVISRTPPESSLVSFKPIFSLISQVIIQILFLMFTYYWTRSRPWFVPYVPALDPHEEFFTHIVTAIFYVSAFQFIIMAHVAAKGPPFRQPIYTNFWFMAASFISISFTVILLILFPPLKLAKFFYLEPLPVSEKYYNQDSQQTNANRSNYTAPINAQHRPHRNIIYFDPFGPRMIIIYIALVDYIVSIFFETFVTDRIIGPLTKGRDLWLRKKVPRYKCNLNQRYLTRSTPISPKCSYSTKNNNNLLNKDDDDDDDDDEDNDNNQNVKPTRNLNTSTTPNSTSTAYTLNSTLTTPISTITPSTIRTSIPSNSCISPITTTTTTTISSRPDYQINQNNDAMKNKMIPIVTNVSLAAQEDETRENKVSKQDNIFECFKEAEITNRIPPLGETYIPKDITKL